ncbi:hypothetical protein Cni_G24847 [Canna indica]|uniref:Uncharacterized protein n=1 Tax=Canna indica TaxID=4628 RepID=A0AAQ3QPY6_9LILI|nr:hypothetical protein Cni_G24847 [Canna indica]
MWSPPAAHKDLDAGSASYIRAPPWRSKPPRTTPTAAPLCQPSPFSSAVPFSWEHRPGIPKTSGGPLAAARSSGGSSVLPLPPPLRCNPAASSLKIKQRPVVAHDDPFAAALAECAKGPAPGPDLKELFARSGSVAGRGRRATAASWSIADRLGLFGLHPSCKATCAVADSTVFIPRPVSRTGAAYGHLNRRST